MFNFKKIGITLGILGVVGLTGALMVGPAFAAPKAKVTMCHYGAYEEIITVVDDVEVTTIDEAGWALINVSESSVPDHLLNHFEDVEGGAADFVADTAELVADCQLMIDAIIALEVEEEEED